MAVPALSTYSAATGQPIAGGRWPGGLLTGGVELSAVVAAGAMASSSSDLTGGVTLSDVVAAGSMSDGRPSWLTAAAVNEWIAVPGSTIQGSPAWQAMPSDGNFWGNHTAYVNGENGTGLDEDTSTLWLFGGGHSDYAGNELSSIRLDVESPAWVQRCARSDPSAMKLYASGGTDPTWNTDGKPASRHSYQGTHYIRKLGKYFAIDGYTWDSANMRCMEPATFDVAGAAWDAQGTWTAQPVADSSSTPGIYAKHPTTEDIYYAPGGGYKLFKLDTTTKAWTTLSSSIGSGKYWPGTECGAIDPTRNALVVLSTRAGTSLANFRCYSADLTSGVVTEITINTSAALTEFQALSTNHGGLVYNDDQDCFYYYFGGSGGSGQGGVVWKLTPHTGSNWDLEKLTMTGVTVPNGVGVAAGNTLSRFRYVPALKAVCVLVAAGSPIYMARVA